jgi:hypothetical protein
MEKDATNPDFVARVGNIVVSRLLLRTLTLASTDKANALRDVIDRELLIEMAIDRGLDLHEQARNYMAASAAKVRGDIRIADLDENEQERVVEGDLLTEAERKQIISQFPVSRSEVESYYSRHKGDFAVPEMDHVSLIMIGPSGIPADLHSTSHARREDVLEARRKAEVARKLIMSGEKFEDVARKFSNASATRLDLKGGIVAMPVGKVSDVLQAPQGFIVLEVTERSQAHVRTFAEAEGEVTSILTRQSVREYLDLMRNYSFLEVRDGFVDEADDEAVVFPVFDPRKGLIWSMTLLCAALGSVFAIELILRRQSLG